MMGSYAQNGTTWASMDAMHQWMTTGGGMHTFVWNTLADKLGLGSDKLIATVNSGKTIIQLAQEKRISRVDLVATLETAHQRSLAQAVKNGVLTQAQADSIAGQMAGQYDWMLDHMGQDRQYGGCRMMYGQGGAGGCGRYGYGLSATPAPKP